MSLTHYCHVIVHVYSVPDLIKCQMPFNVLLENTIQSFNNKQTLVMTNVIVKYICILHVCRIFASCYELLLLLKSTVSVHIYLVNIIRVLIISFIISSDGWL